MTKSELKTGMIVTRRDGKKLTVYKDCVCAFENEIHKNVLVDASRACWHPLDYFSEDLRNLKGYSEFDIVKVEIVHHPYDFNEYPNKAKVDYVAWERSEPAKKMTVAEIEAILGYKVEIVSEVK